MLKYIVALMAITTLTFAEEGQKPQRPFDTDGDKGLNKTEWVARAAARFDLLDTNKDGTVSIAEERAGMKDFIEKLRERLGDRREHGKDPRKDRPRELPKEPAK